MFKPSTPESRVQARKDAVAIGATQNRVQARLEASKGRVMASKLSPPMAVAAFIAFIGAGTKIIESINL